MKYMFFRNDDDKMSKYSRILVDDFSPFFFMPTSTFLLKLAVPNFSSFPYLSALSLFLLDGSLI